MAFRIISVSLVIICVALVIYPFIPAIWYWVKYDVFDYEWERQQSSSGSDISAENDGGSEDGRSYGFNLQIPSIGVDVKIVEGDSDSSLDLGVWRRPDTGDPENGGNMVLTGHRFQYLPPNNTTFYHLPKVEVGDEIIVYWDEIEYDYIVNETFVVEPDAVEIEEDSAYPMLTLYTCTPLWTADKRFVVRAEPVE